jgi:hypothetical protein
LKTLVERCIKDKSMRLSFVLPILLAALGADPRVPAQRMGTEWPDRETIEHFLREAKVTERKKIGEGVTNPEKVTLELDGVVRNAIFKKVDKDHDSWRSEVAAYELDKLLELGMVPPTVPRSIKGRKGCLQLWVTGTVMSKFEGEFPDLEDWHVQVSVMWLFDDLTANIDRHLNNAMVSPEGNLMLIDNSKTFRYEKRLLNDLNGSGTGTHAKFWNVAFDPARETYETRYPASFVERLRRVSDDEIEKTIKEFVWGQNRELVLERRKLILRRLDEMGLQALSHERAQNRPPRAETIPGDR